MVTPEIPGYDVHEVIGRGGFGTVYRATHRKLGRACAIKVVQAHLVDDELRRLFEREVRIAGMLRHPNLVDVLDAGDVDGSPFLVMELLDGETLSQRAARQRLSLDEAIGITEQILEGLHAAHVKGVIHRDVKPANIWICDDGVVKVLDFGIARAKGLTTHSLSARGFGTAGYMSPEQLQEMAVDGRSDLYSVGCLLYELIAGQPPYVATSPVSLGLKHLNEPVPRLPLAPGSDRQNAIAAVLMRAMAKNPAGRFESAREMRQALAATAGPQASGQTQRAASATTEPAPEPTDVAAPAVRAAVPSSPASRGERSGRTPWVRIMAWGVLAAAFGWFAFAVFRSPANAMLQPVAWGSVLFGFLAMAAAVYAYRSS